MRRAGFLAGLLLCLVSLPLSADAPADIRSALDALGPPGTVKVRITISRQTFEKDKPKGGERTGAAIVEYGTSGLTIRLEPDQLPKPAAKSERKRREATTTQIDIDEALMVVDPAAAIRRILDTSAVLSDRVELFEGNPVRTVVLRVAPDFDEEDRKRIKRYEEVVTIRLDAEGVPIALDRTIDVKGSMLIISFTSSQRETRKFARVAGRLVTTVVTEENTSSGFGWNGKTTARWTATPL